MWGVMKKEAGKRNKLSTVIESDKKIDNEEEPLSQQRYSTRSCTRQNN